MASEEKWEPGFYTNRTSKNRTLFGTDDPDIYVECPWEIPFGVVVKPGERIELATLPVLPDWERALAVMHNNGGGRNWREW